MNTISEGVRWTLVLGCAVIAALEAPQASLLLAQDFAGPYTETAAVSAARAAGVAPSAAPRAALARAGVLPALMFAWPHRSSSFPYKDLESTHVLDSDVATAADARTQRAGR